MPTRLIEGDEPQSSKTTERSWTQVVRKKPKPVQPVAATPPPASVPTQTPRPNASASKSARPDERVFLRVKPDHPWTRMSPHFIKISLASKLRLANSAIKQVIVVNSGFAIQAEGDGARSALLSGAALLDSAEMKLEAASNWISVLAPNTPDRLYTLEGPTPVTSEMVIEEATLKTGVRSTSARAFATSMARQSTDWVLHFATGNPKLGERLFKERGRLYELQRKAKIAQCNQCWGHHPTKICSRAERCSRCGSIEHKATECKQLVPRCINCHGPHAATEPSCMARPTRAGGKTVQRTRDQLSVIREQGQKERNASIRELEAKQKAAEATAENETINVAQCP